MIFPETLDEIFEYSKNVEDLGYFLEIFQNVYYWIIV